jgi:YggT family protein
MITILFDLLLFLIRLYFWAIVAVAIFSTLASFGVLDTRNRFVWTIGDFLYRITEPVLRPIRNFLPHLGGIDISPLIVIALIQIVIVPLIVRIQAAVTLGAWQSLVL